LEQLKAQYSIYPGVKRHGVLTVIPVISHPYAPLTVQGVAQYLTQYPLEENRIRGHDKKVNVKASRVKREVRM
jgi:hypothetical protein